jgi:hypothetical protein
MARALSGVRERNLDLGQLPPQLGDIGLPGAGAGDDLGGIAHRQPERDQGRGDLSEVVHRNQYLTALLMQRRDDHRAQIADAQSVDLALELDPFQGRGIDGIQPFVQFQGRRFEQPAFQQPPRHLQKLALGLLLADVNHRAVLAQQQPVDDGLQHRRFADPDRTGQDQVSALAGFAGDLFHQIFTPDQSGDQFHSGSLP